MSIEAISWVIKQDIPDGVAKLVAMVLADYADRHTGEAHPKIRQLAEACSQSERSVQRKLRVLQELDVITIQLGHCPKSGRQRANSYILHLPGVDVPGRGDQIDPGYDDPEPRGDFGAPHVSGQGCLTVTGEGDSVVTGEGDSPVTPIENPSDSTVRKESPQPPGGGTGAFPKLVRGNGVTAAVVVDRPAWRGGTPALDPPTAAAFDRLWSAFPEGGRIDADRNAAERIFAGLAPADQDLAVTAAAAYASHVRKHEARPKALHTWLRQRRFVNLRPVGVPSAAAGEPRVFVREGSAEWEAWARHLRAEGRRMTPATRSDTHRAEGWWFPSLLPPESAAA